MGFGYSAWKDVFYPKSVKAPQYLEYYAQHFDAVELDTTFHAMPTADRVKKWASLVPADFRFTVKTPKQVTHEGDLLGNLDLMKAFIDVMRELGPNLGVILIQFSPYFDVKYRCAVEQLLDILPTDVKFAVEFRHASWHNVGTAQMLHDRGLCYTGIDFNDAAVPVRATCDFQYVRWLGEHDRFPACNRVELDMEERLQWWIDKITQSTQKAPVVYGMFNNDFNGYSIAAMEQLMKLIGIKPKPHRADVTDTLFG